MFAIAALRGVTGEHVKRIVERIGLSSAVPDHVCGALSHGGGHPTADGVLHLFKTRATD